MSAAFSQTDKTKQSDLTETAQDVRPGQVAWRSRWTSLLSLGWATKCTVIVSLTGALVGIPAGLVKWQQHMEILTNPHKMEVLGGELTISYVPEHQQVELAIGFKAKEKGHRDNQILSAKAGVEVPSAPLAVDGLDAGVYFLEDEFRIDKPVITAGGEPREMKCCLVSHLNERTRDLFQTAGLRRLVVVLKGKDKSYTLTFCFELDDNAIHGLFHTDLKLVRYLASDLLTKDQEFSAEISHGGSYDYQN